MHRAERGHVDWPGGEVGMGMMASIQNGVDPHVDLGGLRVPNKDPDTQVWAKGVLAFQRLSAPVME